MKFFKTAFCIALLLVLTNAYANQNNFCQSPDSLFTDEYPVYGDVLKDAYFFLFFSPDQKQNALPVLFFSSGWEYNGTDNFQKLKIFADDYMTNHYGKFVFEVGQGSQRQAFFMDFFTGSVTPIPLQENGYGPQDDDDIEYAKEAVIHYRPDENQIVPFAKYGTSEMCYISLQNQQGDWYFVFLHTGVLCF